VDDEEEPTRRPHKSSSPSSNKKKPSVDIASLKPECAEIYVKFEKLLNMMDREDKEFITFRKDYLRRERQRRLENPF
jgi:hypothetical protein